VFVAAVEIVEGLEGKECRMIVTSMLLIASHGELGMIDITIAWPHPNLIVVKGPLGGCLVRCLNDAVDMNNIGSVMA
jgi:hypothetical protein